MLTAGDLGADLTKLPPDQKTAIMPLLFELAPGNDPATLGKRRWVAARLRMPLPEVNRALWAQGVRWRPELEKQPRKMRWGWGSKRRGKP